MNVNTEIEAKFLDINLLLLRERLKRVDARLVHSELLMKRKNFDFPDKSLEKIGAWIRVRDEGDKITLSYKRLLDRTLHGTKDITVEVNDFERTCSLLLLLGLKLISFQETKREKWTYGNSEITIDTWPWIPSFVEIESPNENELRNVADLLCFSWSSVLHGSVEIIYQKYFDVTEQEVDNWETITFTSVPKWLENKRIKSE
ncbi:CYTH domain-containing protein [Candidatus Woesearchaeota archaeon]|nr:CYTH domain-containing protein [Candidatus Woesearchaeota archaeon]